MLVATLARRLVLGWLFREMVRPLVSKRTRVAVKAHSRALVGFGQAGMGAATGTVARASPATTWKLPLARVMVAVAGAVWGEARSDKPRARAVVMG